jgi:hypothetical protein
MMMGLERRAAVERQAPGAPEAPANPDDRSTTFQPVPVNAGETRSGSTLLIEAYAVLWVILMAWLFFQWRKQASLGARLDELERAIDRAASNSDKK